MQDLRQLPSVDELSRSPLLAAYPDRVRIQAARQAVAELRQRLAAGDTPSQSAEEMAASCAQAASASSLGPVINLSGVILHTGAGRARLAQSAADHLAEVAGSHSNVEFDLEEGRRGNRQDHVRGLLKELTGAEDALVVNNAAAGVFLTLSALCSGKEVILSRGQMVEIGGSFRMPDIVRQSGCRLVEVGCTNKTRLSDYESALTTETSAVLRCHPSNFKVIGFTEEPSLEALSAFCREHEKLLIDDQGSGCLVDFRRFGLPAEPTLPQSVANSDVSIASGDKLIGGPQAGLILGTKFAIAKIASHPIARCVRVDKLTLAALESTLRLYVEGREEEIPTLRYLARDVATVRRFAEKIAAAYGRGASLEDGVTEIGGGSAPGTVLPTVRVGLPSSDPEGLARSLRQSSPGILGRIEDGKVWLDPRTLEESELPEVERILLSIP